MKAYGDIVIIDLIKEEEPTKGLLIEKKETYQKGKVISCGKDKDLEGKIVLLSGVQYAQKYKFDDYENELYLFPISSVKVIL